MSTITITPRAVRASLSANETLTNSVIDLIGYYKQMPSIKQNNDLYFSQHVMTDLSKGTISFGEQYLHTLGFVQTDPVSRVTYGIRLTGPMEEADMEAYGDELHKIDIVDTGGVDGYTAFVFTLAQFMYLTTIDHEGDVIKRCTTAAYMTLGKGYTPMKPFLSACMSQSAELTKMSKFMSQTADIIHRLEFFQYDLGIIDSSKFKQLYEKYSAYFGPVDRTIAALQYINDNESMLELLPAGSDSLITQFLNADGGLVRRVTLSETNAQTLTMLRRTKAIAVTPLDTEERKKQVANQLRTMTGVWSEIGVAAKRINDGDDDALTGILKL